MLSLRKLFKGTSESNNIRACYEQLSSEWKVYFSNHPLKDSEYLDELMIEFEPRARKVIENTFPKDYRNSPTVVLIEIAVELSGTHSPEEIKKAAAEIIFGTRRELASADALLRIAKQIETSDK